MDGMMPVDLYSTLTTHKRRNVRRRRHQQGSLQVRKHGKKKMWVFLYRDGESKRYETLGLYSEMTKTQAQEKSEEILREVNHRSADAPDRDIGFGEFVEKVALPFCRTNWKKSTAGTTENRFRHHLIQDLGQ
jgi:hypothetical protein